MILRATGEDLPVLVALDRELFGADTWSERSIASDVAADHRHVAVAIDDRGVVIGYAITSVVAVPDEGGTADLLRIGVAAGHRRRGHASELLADASRFARAAGAHAMALEVAAGNAAAADFYRVHGFVTIDRRPAYYRDGTDALVMHTPLRPPVL
ncbi:MAG: GNAT family N-acetyltransferase [Nocardioides sp.]